MEFTFTETATRETTVKRLLAEAGVSHRLFSRLAAGHHIQLNGRTVQNVAVRAGQTVTFTLPHDGHMVTSDGPLDVRLETDNWLIVIKPNGLSSVPGPANPTDSLVNRVAGYLTRGGYVGVQPAVITRLDRDTAGLVLVAKHPFAQGRLDQLGTAAQLEKQYLALASGRMPETWGRIEKPLGRAADGIHQEVQREGKQSRTDYEVLQRGANATLLSLHLLTGRTHQIRVHLASCGHPLLGDTLYGGPVDQLQGQALVAAELAFTDPFTNDRLHVKVAAPETWREVLG